MLVLSWWPESSKKKKMIGVSCAFFFPFQKSLNKMDGKIRAVKKVLSLCRVAQESASNAAKVGLCVVLVKLNTWSLQNQGPCLHLKSKSVLSGIKCKQMVVIKNTLGRSLFKADK